MLDKKVLRDAAGMLRKAARLVDRAAEYASGPNTGPETYEAQAQAKVLVNAKANINAALARMGGE